MNRISISASVLLVAVLGLVQQPPAVRAAGVSTDELKQRLAHAAAADQPALCIQIAHLQLGEASKLYSSNEPVKAAALLDDVVVYSERARDVAIATRSHEKQTEIGVRKMIHRLTDMKRAAVQADQAPIKAVTDRLDRVRDALLAAMFPKHPDKR